MHIPCRVASCTPISVSVYRVILVPVNGQPIPFRAGQHLQIQLLSGEFCPFSIASSPRDNRTIELHILNVPEQESSRQVFETLKQPTIMVDPPQGDCYLPDTPVIKDASPLILIAAGTGFAQMLSILHEVFARKMSNPIHLYRGERKAENLYSSEHILAWLEEHSNFHYIPVISEAGKDSDWQGRQGLLHDAVCEDFDNFEGAQVFISGSPAMVYATLDVMVDHGLDESQVHSDTFSYAPR